MLLYIRTQYNEHGRPLIKYKPDLICASAKKNISINKMNTTDNRTANTATEQKSL